MKSEPPNVLLMSRRDLELELEKLRFVLEGLKDPDSDSDAAKPRQLVVVFAGRLDLAKRWAVDQHFPASPRMENGWIYCMTEEQTHGLKNVVFAVLPSFYCHSRSRFEQRRRDAMIRRAEFLVERGFARFSEIHGDY